MLAYVLAGPDGSTAEQRAFAARPTGSPGPESTADPLAILRRRYAAGEIDQPTYDRMRTELEATDVISPRERMSVDGMPERARR
jgi:hypothetical protein